MGWWKEDQENMRQTEDQGKDEGRGGAGEGWREGGGRGRK